MAEDFKSSKTRQVMNLIHAPSSEANPFLPGVSKSAGRKKNSGEPTVESKLWDYTAAKRGISDRTAAKKTSSLRNPSLHIPEDADEKAVSAAPMKKTKHSSKEKITIDINRIILDDMLEDVLERFNTCHCEKCRERIAEKVLDHVPVKIITVSPAEERSVIDSYCDHTRKEISSVLVKIIMQNKRRPFHD